MPSILTIHIALKVLVVLIQDLTRINLCPIVRIILGWRSVTYHFWVTVTWILTCDLVFRIMFRAYLLYYLRDEYKIWCVGASLGWSSVEYHLRFTVTLTSDLV